MTDLDDINAYLKNKVQRNDQAIKQHTLMMREYERNAYPPKRHFEKNAALYQTHSKPVSGNPKWGASLPSLPKDASQLDFSKTQCNETRYLKHLKDTRVVFIMRSNKEFSMGNVPSK